MKPFTVILASNTFVAYILYMFVCVRACVCMNTHLHAGASIPFFILFGAPFFLLLLLLLLLLVFLLLRLPFSFFVAFFLSLLLSFFLSFAITGGAPAASLLCYAR